MFSLSLRPPQTPVGAATVVVVLGVVDGSWVVDGVTLSVDVVLVVLVVVVTWEALQASGGTSGPHCPVEGSK